MSDEKPADPRARIEEAIKNATDYQCMDDLMIALPIVIRAAKALLKKHQHHRKNPDLTVSCWHCSELSDEVCPELRRIVDGE